MDRFIIIGASDLEDHGIYVYKHIYQELLTSEVFFVVDNSKWILFGATYLVKWFDTNQIG
jgi:hypothetical protein